MKKAIEHFKNNISSNFVVVGSWALVVAGGFNIVPVDVDIEIDITDADLIKKLRVLESASKKVYNNYDEAKRIDFEYQGFRFNAFLVENSLRGFIWKDYIKYSTVIEVLAFKKKYGRSKDYKAINSIVKEIIG